MVLSDCSFLMYYQAINDSSPSPAGITALLSQKGSKAWQARRIIQRQGASRGWKQERELFLSFPPPLSCSWIGPVLPQVASEVR